MITHSSGDFIVKNARNHRLYTLQILQNRRGGKFKCFVELLRSNALFMWRHEDTSSSRLLSDDNSGRQMMSNFSLRQRLHLLLVPL